MALPDAFDALRDERYWVAWNDEGGRKVPKSPFCGNARSNDPSTWGTYDEAAAAASRNGYSGVGLMLSDGYIGIDLDGAIDDDGNIEPWAQEIVDELGSYAERSPSGRGIHVLAWADMDQVGPIGRADHGAGIEVYNHGRYFTVTGDKVSGGRIYDLTEEIPGFVARHFAGESPEQSVRRRVGDLASAEVKRMANKTMTDNCLRDGVRYARVPVGAETCEFCIMLASRGFVYHSERSAGELNHYHQNCDCKVVPGFPGMEVEGYDPDAYYELWRKSEELKGAEVPRAQREAVMAAMRDRLMPQYSVGAAELTSAYQRGLDSAWLEFKRSGKTREGYGSTVGAFLADMGDASGAGFSAEFMAKPDGNELWAATKLAGEFESIRFRYADYRSPNPDFLLDGEMAELKTPSSRKKVTNRLSDIPRQFSPYPDERRVGIVSTIYLPDDVSYVKETSQRFVNDGTLDEVMVILPGGTTERLSKQ